MPRARSLGVLARGALVTTGVFGATLTACGTPYETTGRLAAPPPAEIAAAATPAPAEIVAAPSVPVVGDGTVLAPLPPLSADTAIDLVVEHAALPPEARLLARSLRPTMTAEFDTGAWTVTAGSLGHWRVYDGTWLVEPADGVAELWDIQSRLDLR